MTRLRINERYLQLKDKGIVKDKLILAKKLYPNMSDQSAINTFYSLCAGRPKTIKLEWVGIICEELETTPDQLFGIN